MFCVDVISRGNTPTLSRRQWDNRRAVGAVLVLLPRAASGSISAGL